MPPPAFVQVGVVSKARAKKAGKAVLSFSQPLGPLQGFKAGGGGFRRIAGLAAKRKYKMTMVTTRVPRLQTNLVNASALRYEYASLDSQYQVKIK
jgi:hypothetical protein